MQHHVAPSGSAVAVVVAKQGIPIMSSTEDRRALLSERPVALGAYWAKVWCEEMQREGRAIDGGWPGTLPEARARVRAVLDPELTRRKMPLLTLDELVAATRAAYEEARREWLKAVRRVSSRRALRMDDDLEGA
jgi:hypothetical protein